MGICAVQKFLSYTPTYAASINIHNHVKTGSMGLTGVILTTSPHIRQFIEILVFLFTNSYLAYRYFKPYQTNLKHVAFALANQLLELKMLPRIPVITRGNIVSTLDNEISMVVNSHTPVKLPKVCTPSLSAECRGGEGGLSPLLNFQKEAGWQNLNFFRNVAGNEGVSFFRGLQLLHTK